MMYLVIAYNDDTTLGLKCEGFNIEHGLLYTYGDGYKIKDVIPGYNVKAISQVSEEEFESYLIEEFDDEPDDGSVGLAVS